MQWKPIPGFDGYEVSDTGIVQSNKWGRSHQLKPGVYNKGYLFVVLRRDNKSYHKSVHRLVLAAFTGGERPGMQARHLNGDSMDNRLENLTWGTNTQNFEDAVRHGTNGRGSKSPVAKYTEDQIRLLWQLRQNNVSHKTIAERTGIKPGTVKNIIEGRSWRHLNPNLQT